MTIKELFKVAPVTTLLLSSFIALFVMQVLTGVDANQPSTESLLRWGANAFPFTMDDEPWRLISSGFLHIGLMHLLFNGFAMYFFGQIAEPMFGSVKFLALFLLAVIGGNLLNSQLKWFWILDTGIDINQHRIIEILGLSAGASGGIMGIGAALLVAAFFKMSVNGMMLNLRSLIFIMGINLVYGFAVPGIDNAGHIGGALTGLLIALPIAFAYRQRLRAQQATTPTHQTDSAYHPPLTNIFDANSDHIPVNLDKNMTPNVYTDASADAAVNNRTIAPASNGLAILWQWLPWITMLIITVGFIWWWQDIHQQFLQLVTATQSLAR